MGENSVAELNLDELGYESDGASDSVAYSCSLCGVGLYFNKQRRIPDDFCSRCYSVIKPYREEPWVKFLVSKENSRRVKLLRYRKRGIDYLPISYEEYIAPILEIEG